MLCVFYYHYHQKKKKSVRGKKSSNEYFQFDYWKMRPEVSTYRI